MRTPVLLGACALLAGGCIADDGSGAVYAPERVIWVRGAGYRHEVFLSRSPVLVPAFAGEGGTCEHYPQGSGDMKVTLPAPENGERVVFLRTGVHGLDAFTEMRRAPNQDLTMITILPQERTGTVVSKSLRFGDTTVVGVGTAEEVMESEALGHPRQLIERILALCGQAWK